MSDHPLYHVEYGDGVPVLALHGWSPDHRLMTGCLEPVFASRLGYRRIYPDLPGMGHSPAPESIASGEDVLAVVEGLLAERVGSEPFLVVGQSYGGYLARALAHRRPDQVLGLALICPAGNVFDRARRTVPPYQILVSEPNALDSLAPDEREDFTESAVVQTAETVRRFQQDVAPGVALADRMAMARIQPRREFAVPPEAGAFDRPTLILTGRQDSIAGYADIYPLLDHYPRATFVILDRAGHNLQIEQSELFGRLLGEWLDRVAEAVGHQVAVSQRKAAVACTTSEDH